MSLQCGIVGLPNVGKSTLFNALTKAGVAAANYPFCTIEPNVGVVPVPDPRLDGHRGDRQAQRRSSPPPSSSSTSRGWCRAPRRARAWATSSSPTSARPTPSRTSCAASRTTTSCTSPAASIPSPTSRPSTRSWRWPISATVDKRLDKRAQARSALRATRRPRSWSPCWRRCEGRSTGQAGAGAGLAPEEMELLRAALPAHAQARALRRQRGGARRSTDNPLAREGEGHTRAKEGAPVVAICAKLESGDRGRSPARTRTCSSRTWACRSRGSTASSAPTYRPARPADVLHGRREGGAAPGRSTRATPLRRPPASSTPTSRRASSAPRSSPTTTSSPARASRARKRGKMRLEGKEYVVQDGDVMHFRFNV